MDQTLQTRVAARLKARREEVGLTQEQLAEKLGFNQRQTLADIEIGKRAIAPDELARAAELLGVDLDYLTDPFQLVGEGEFSFRGKAVAAGVIDGFQRDAGRWIATYRTLGRQAGVSESLLGSKLELSRHSSFEDASESAEQLRRNWNLGDIPAEFLDTAIARELGALVLYVDAPAGISGAASYVPGLRTILVNRREPVGRRSFDLAHELFHLLTWDAMPPKRIESTDTPSTKGNRPEVLADNFAAALLMPRHVVNERWSAREESEIHDWLNTTATVLRVTSLALKWRLRNLGLLSERQIGTIDDARLAANGGLVAHEPVPLLFHADFVRRLYNAVEAGRLSLRKACRLLGMTVSEFASLCGSYGLTLSYEV